MFAGKNLKQLVELQHRTTRQASDNKAPDTQLPLSRPPSGTSERVLLRRLYFLNPQRTKYVRLCFYRDRDNRAFF